MTTRSYSFSLDIRSRCESQSCGTPWSRLFLDGRERHVRDRLATRRRGWRLRLGFARIEPRHLRSETREVVAQFPIRLVERFELARETSRPQPRCDREEQRYTRCCPQQHNRLKLSQGSWLTAHGSRCLMAHGGLMAYGSWLMVAHGSWQAHGLWW